MLPSYVCPQRMVVVVPGPMPGKSKDKTYYFLKPSDRADDDRDTGSTVWRGFKEKTTVHGIPHTDRAAGEWGPGLSDGSTLSSFKRKTSALFILINIMFLRV